jgi:hypothetical protein
MKDAAARSAASFHLRDRAVVYFGGAEAGNNVSRGVLMTRLVQPAG